MRLALAARELAQLCFDFFEGKPAPVSAPPPPPAVDLTTRLLSNMGVPPVGVRGVPPQTADAGTAATPTVETTVLLSDQQSFSVSPLPSMDEADEEDGDGEAAAEDSSQRVGRDDELEGQCRQLLMNLGIKTVTDLISVHWNPRLRSTAGYAAYPSWRIELNPRLIGFEGQVARTLKHELAHLVAYHRAGRRRIEPHGNEWRQACADLGIEGEVAHHRLPFPRSTMQRNHAYQCPACGIVVGRVRPFKRATACLVCCRKHSGGAFDARFKFVKVPPRPQS